MTAFIDEPRGRFGVEPICRVLAVSASAYYRRVTGRRSQRVIVAHHDARSGRDAQPGRVNRNFSADRPDALWVANFTYVRC